ncbi:hypothetical protein [Mesomycoplasma ovipneumoniae]|uniref:hypothetical protein n=1 Tax=Mesomycoplasma ovipneumoniae TaxID=29562 RepID=UPI00307FFA72
MTIFAVLAVVTNDFLSSRVGSVSSRSTSSSWIAAVWESTLSKTGSTLSLERLERNVWTTGQEQGVASF